jgi:hypothetical protein
MYGGASVTSKTRSASTSRAEQLRFHGGDRSLVRRLPNERRRLGLVGRLDEAAQTEPVPGDAGLVGHQREPERLRGRAGPRRAAGTRTSTRPPGGTVAGSTSTVPCSFRARPRSMRTVAVPLFRSENRRSTTPSWWNVVEAGVGRRVEDERARRFTPGAGPLLGPRVLRRAGRRPCPASGRGSGAGRRSKGSSPQRGRKGWERRPAASHPGTAEAPLVHGEVDHLQGDRAADASGCTSAAPRGAGVVVRVDVQVIVAGGWGAGSMTSGPAPGPMRSLELATQLGPSPQVPIRKSARSPEDPVRSAL